MASGEEMPLPDTSKITSPEPVGSGSEASAEKFKTPTEHPSESSHSDCVSETGETRSCRHVNKDNDGTQDRLSSSGLLEVKPEKIKVKSPDPSAAALMSARKWEDLNLSPELLKGVYAKGFLNPSFIQGRALPLVLNKPIDLIAQAHNGSGKTATFALCMLAKCDKLNPQPQALCVCHTRELALQNIAVIRELGRYTDATTYAAVAQGERYDKSKPAQLIVGTPGKLGDLIKRRFLPTPSIHLLVLDEADVLMDQISNMAHQMVTIRRSLENPSLQTLLFSATYPDRVKSYCASHMPSATRLEVEREELALAAVSQYWLPTPGGNSEKEQVLSDLYGCCVVGQSVIFTNTRASAWQLAQRMKADGNAVSLICGTQASGPEKMEVETRERVMDEFRRGETTVLIATDVLARGIDVPQVTLVINYDIPMLYHGGGVDYETYIHRIGRTGRFGLKGMAITLVDIMQPAEINHIRDIESYYSHNDSLDVVCVSSYYTFYIRCEIKELPQEPDTIEKIVRSLRV